jgi:hypothetical protein
MLDDIVLNELRSRYVQSPVSLTPTDENLRRALFVEWYGIERGFHFLTPSVIAYYGYRYRRLENFTSKSLGMYDNGKWEHTLLIFKIYLDYLGRSQIHVEFEIKAYYPLSKIYFYRDEGGKLENYLVNITLEAIEQTPFFQVYWDKIKVGKELKHEYQYEYYRENDLITYNAELRISEFKTRVVTVPKEQVRLVEGKYEVTLPTPLYRYRVKKYRFRIKGMRYPILQKDVEIERVGGAEYE